MINTLNKVLTFTLVMSIIAVVTLAFGLTHVSGHIDIDFGNSALAYQIPMKAVAK